MQCHEASLLDVRHGRGGQGRDCNRYLQILVEALGKPRARSRQRKRDHGVAERHRQAAHAGEEFSMVDRISPLSDLGEARIQRFAICHGRDRARH
jgi:hypothetical protein